MTDGELVEQVRAGETAAFGELVERHRGAVYRAALAALGNEADAEDIAQEALVLAFRRIDQFRGDASVRTWMISIAWRLSMKRRRRVWWKVTRTAVPETELHVLRDVSPSPEARGSPRNSSRPWSRRSGAFRRSCVMRCCLLPPEI